MRNLSYRNLQRMCSNIQGDMSQVASSAVCTFEEVYKNLDTLDEKIQGVTYSAASETITIPESIGSYANETIILK